MQIEDVHPSESFLKSNELAVAAKNAAVAAENQLKTKEFEARQTEATAKGAADSAIQRARGEAEATRLNAEAEKVKLELQGKGEQVRLESEIKALGSAEYYIKYLQAKAQLNWRGDVPQVTTGTGAGANFVLPLPPLGREGANPAPSAPLSGPH